MKLFVLEWEHAGDDEGGRATARGIAAGGAVAARAGSLHIIGDIRIDARAELKRALSDAGYPQQADAGDADLVLAAWQAWGDACTARLLGDFSFVIWDDAHRVVFCARDQLGVRPLYYAVHAGGFICSNTLDAIRASRAVTSRLHEPALVSFLECGWNRDLTTTTFTDIRRLPPAHQIVCRDGRPADPARYWHFPVPEPLIYRSDPEYIEHFRALLAECVRDRAGTGPIALMMSGGLDSTSLAATLRRVVPDQPVIAYTTDVGDVVPNDDARLARVVAGQLGLRHVISSDIPVALEHLADADFRSPEPLDEPEYAAWRRLMAGVESGSGSLLLGEDGDALFAPPGAVRTLRRWPTGGWFVRFVRHWASTGRRPHLGVNWRARGQALVAPRWTPRPWLRPEFASLAAAMREPDHGTHPSRPEAHRFLVGTIWQSVHEVFSPAYSGAAVEMRWPLLDLRMLEFALAVPPMPWCQGKELMRRAFASELPPEVIRRPKTTLSGYEAVEVTRWRESRAGSVAPFTERTREFIDRDRAVAALFDGSPDEVFAAWRVLALDRWLRDLE